MPRISSDAKAQIRDAFNGTDTAKFNATKDVFDNGVSQTPANAIVTPATSLNAAQNTTQANVTQVANNTFNQQQKANAALTSKQQDLSIGSVFDFKSANNEFNIGGAGQYTPDFLKTDIGRLANNSRDVLRSKASSLVSRELFRQGIKVKKSKEDIAKQKDFNQILFGGAEGSISGSGLLAVQDYYGDKALDALMADNRLSLYDIEVKSAQLKVAGNDKITAPLQKYIKQEQSILVEDFDALVQSGGIAAVSDEALVTLSKNAGISTEKAFGLRKAVQNLQTNIEPIQSKQTITTITNEIVRQNSPSGYLMRGNKNGGLVDKNGVYRFNKPKSITRMQCAEWVNDALGFSVHGGKLGSSWESKQRKTSGDTPIELGFFVQSGGVYGHTGVVEQTYEVDGVQYMEIAESNYNGAKDDSGKEKFRRQTLHRFNSNPLEWMTKSGKIRTFTGFGGNKLERDVDNKAVDPIIQQNTQVAEKISSEAILYNNEVYAQPEIVSAAKSRFEAMGFTGQKLDTLTAMTQSHGGMQNALLTNYFNEKKIPLPQKLLDAQPRDSVQLAGQLASLYGKDVPKEIFQQLNQAGIIDVKISAAYQHATNQKEREKINKLAVTNKLKASQESRANDANKRANDANNRAGDANKRANETLKLNKLKESNDQKNKETDQLIALFKKKNGIADDVEIEKIDLSVFDKHLSDAKTASEKLAKIPKDYFTTRTRDGSSKGFGIKILQDVLGKQYFIDNPLVKQTIDKNGVISGDFEPESAYWKRVQEDANKIIQEGIAASNRARQQKITSFNKSSKLKSLYEKQVGDVSLLDLEKLASDPNAPSKFAKEWEAHLKRMEKKNNELIIK